MNENNKPNSQVVFDWLRDVIHSVNHSSQIASCELLIENFKKNYVSDKVGEFNMLSELERITLDKKKEFLPTVEN